MKRMIKASFGYQDSSWVEPDDDSMDVENATISFPIENVIVTSDSNGDINTPENLDPIINDILKSNYFIDNRFEDPDTGVVLSDKQQAKEDIEYSLDSATQGRFKPNTKYSLNGEVLIEYSYLSYIDPAQRYELVDDAFIDFDRFEANIDIKEA